MREDVLYSHNQSGRRPQRFFATMLCVSMTGLGIWNGLPWFVVLMMCVPCLAVSWPLFTNTQSGALLTRDSLRFFHGKTDCTIRVADIASATRRTWDESPDDVTLTLVSGATVYLPSQSADRGLDAALQRVGIIVQS
jgi:hypothetical protein